VKLRRLVVALVLAALGALLYAGPAASQTYGGPAAPQPNAGPADSQTVGSSGLAFPTVLSAQLTGEQEVPGPGDPDGFGSAFVITDPPNRICYVLTAFNIAPANAAHIHVGPPGVAGDVVVPLEPPTFGVSGGCTTADPALVSAIAANPSNYYVNVHNVPYPDGAIRGQLHY
jgi:CHRD domain-containing protein